LKYIQLKKDSVAALKCRQRKKQWLANLQSKVDLYSQENDALTHTVNQLRDQLMQMKSILVQHKDCPVTVGQGISSQAFTAFLNQDSQLLSYGGPINGVNQGMPMIMPDGRQAPTQIMSRK
jgi:ATF/CREB family transcription factor